MGIGFSVLSTYFFPVTTLSFYCDIAVSRKSVDSLFHRIYYLMLPVGLTCLIITGENGKKCALLIKLQLHFQWAATPSSCGKSGGRTASLSTVPPSR